MVWSFVYLAFRKTLELVMLAGRSDRSKELEILVLRHVRGAVWITVKDRASAILGETEAQTPFGE